MWTKTVVILALLGLVSSAAVRSRKARGAISDMNIKDYVPKEVEQLDMKGTLEDMIHIMEPMESDPTIGPMLKYWRGLSSVLSYDMTTEEQFNAYIAKMYSMVSQDLVQSGVTFPNINLREMMKMIELEKYFGDHLDLDRIAGAMQPFVTSAMTYEQASKYLTDLYTVITSEVNSLDAAFIMTAFNGAIDKLQSLGDMGGNQDFTLLNLFVKRAANIRDNIKDKTVDQIFMEVVAVEMHGLIFNEMLPHVGVRNINILDMIRNLGVMNYTGEVQQLTDLVAILQPLLAKNTTFNETVGIFMAVYDFAQKKASSELDFNAVNKILQTVMSNKKVFDFLPKEMVAHDKFTALIELGKNLAKELPKSNATHFAMMEMANHVYGYVIGEIFPMANLSSVNISAIFKQYQVDKHVKGVISIDEMVQVMQPMLSGSLTMEQAMQVFMNLFKLIEGDAGKVDANTVNVMGNNILDLYQGMMPTPDKYPAAFQEFLTRVHHMYLALPDGDIKSMFNLALTNSIFTRLTGLNINSTPKSITNVLDKAAISQAIGQNIDQVVGLLKPIFDGKIDLEAIPVVYIRILRLFTNGNPNEFAKYEEILRRLVFKMRNYLPNPINSLDAYKTLLNSVKSAKKIMSPEEAAFITSILGELGGAASSLVDGNAVKAELGQDFDLPGLLNRLQPVLDGDVPLTQIPGIFEQVFYSFVNANPNVDMDRLAVIFANIIDRLKFILPDPFGDPTNYEVMLNTVDSVSAGKSEELKDFLSFLFAGSMNDAMKDFGMGGGEDMSSIMQQMDTEDLAAMNEMKKFTAVMDMGSLKGDDFMFAADAIGDIGTEKFGKVMGMADGSATLTAAEMEDVPPEVFGLMDASALRSMGKRLVGDAKDQFCENLLETDGETAEQLMGAVDCSASLKKLEQSGAITIDEEYKESMVESMKKGKAIDQWSESDWTKAMDFAGGMAAEDFGKMPPAVMLNNMATLETQMSTMDDSAMDEMFDSMEEGMDFSTMDGDTFAKMGSFINEMPIDLFEQVPPAQKLKAMKSGNLKIEDEEAASALATELLEVMPPPDQWAAEDFAAVASTFAYDSDVLDKVPIETMVGGLSSLDTMDDAASSSFTERLLDDPTYSSPDNWDANMLANAAPLMSSMPPEFIDGLSAEKVLSVMSSSDKLGKVDFPKSSGRKILEKVKGSLTDIATQLNPDMIKKMGKMIKSFQSDEIGQMGPENLKNSLKHFRVVYDDMEYSTRRSVINKLKTLPGGLSSLLNDLGEFFEDLTGDEIDAFPYDQIRPKKLTVNDTITARPTGGQARRIYANVRARFGSPDSAAGNWTMNMWRFMGRGMCGMPCSDIKKIPLGKKVSSIFKLYADMDDCLDDGQLRCMAGRLKDLIWNTTSDQPLHSVIDKSSISKFGRFAPYFNVSDIEKMNQTLCGHIVGTIGKYPLDNIHRDNLVDLKNYALKCAGKLTSGTLQEKELRMAGDIACGMEPNDLDRFSPKLFKNHFKMFAEKCDFPDDVADKLIAKGMEKMNITAATMKVRDLVRMGPAIIRLPADQLSQIPQDVVFKAAARLAKGFERKKKKMMKRMKMGMRVKDDTSNRGNLNKVMIDVFVNKRNTKNAAGRKRRAATQLSTLTCGDLRKIGTGITSLTTAQLDLTTSQFSSCSDLFGTQTGWSAEQKLQLADTAKLTWGVPSTWSTSTIVAAGTIAQGLNDGELATLKITSIDSISALGKATGWTASQRSTIFNSWLSGTQSGLTTNVDNSELQSIGEFACGASATQIETIPAVSYKGAATRIGQLTACDATQLAAYANLAKNAAAFGAVSTWDAATVSTVGNIFGGVSAADVGTLTQSQIEALTTSAIAMIPVNSFTAFSTTQLGFFSSSQANALTTAQWSALSAAQQAALSGAGAISSSFTPTNTNPPSSSGVFVSSSMAINCVLLLVSFFYMA